ncbi:transporter family protein [Flaviaesturariibacter terrae]
MKSRYALFLLMPLLGNVPAGACDICGCGVSYYNPNLFPHLARNYFGISYLHRVYRTYTDEGAGRESYNSLLLTAQYSVSSRFKLMAQLPWQANSLQGASTVRYLGGLGDASLLGQYRVWDRASDKGLRQTLLLGAGVKLPSGRYTGADAGKAGEQNFQLGTGSTDLLLNGAYRVSLPRWTFSANGSYKYNTSNRDGFRYGDMVSSGLQAAYRKEWRRWSLAPYVQLSGEWQLPDARQHVIQEESGGRVLYTGAGVDINTRRLAFGINYQAAPLQRLAGGQVEVGGGLSLRSTFLF